MSEIIVEEIADGGFTFNLDPETFGRVAKAADKAGLTTEDWFNQALREAMRDEWQTDQRCMDAVRDRFTPYQRAAIVAGAEIEDALDIEPGSLCDPLWLSLVSNFNSGEQNVEDILSGYEMTTYPAPEAIERVQAIIQRFC